MSAEQITDIKGRIELFVAQQNGEIFTIDDVIKFLESTCGFEPTVAGYRSITETLYALGCNNEVLVIYQQKTDNTTPIRERVIERSQLYS